ncbi:hypothetical protein UF75_5230 [Desulfosporosinus sp. I2]|nr:hypothetical protein UF75_5230 [Desulfosporosinus sp. I2]
MVPTVEEQFVVYCFAVIDFGYHYFGSRLCQLSLQLMY